MNCPARLFGGTGAETFEPFGAGTGSDDSAALTAAFAAATGTGGVKLVCQRGKKYKFKSLVTLPAGSVDIDMQGATLEFSNGGTIVSPAKTPITHNDKCENAIGNGTQTAALASTSVVITQSIGNYAVAV